MYGPRGQVCPLVNVDQGQYIRHRVHRDVQTKEVESGGTVLRTDVTKQVQTCLVPWLTSDSTVDVLTLISIKGDSNLQENIRTLWTEFKEIFSNELPAEPAKIEPFNLVVETEKQRVPSNRLPPRPQSVLKQAELVKTLDILKKGGIIELSQASHYSQVLLVPKPDGSSRMFMNYIALNECTPDVSFPIPNIRQLFVRMGTKKPTIFGVTDLTQGYHQAPLTFATRAFTAFITFFLWSLSVYLLTIWVEASTIIFSRNDGNYCVNWINIPYM